MREKSLKNLIIVALSAEMIGTMISKNLKWTAKTKPIEMDLVIAQHDEKAYITQKCTY